MATAYTPGLRVTEYARLRRERRLPLHGRVLVGPGDEVEPDTVVARTELPGHLQAVNLAARLGVDPARAPATLLVPIGSRVSRGDVVAESKSLFGLMRSQVESPADGVVESVSEVTGQLLLREPPIPVEVNGYVRGRVVDVLGDEGVAIEAMGAFVQGIFGVGGETFGPIEVVCDAPDEVLEPRHLQRGVRGKVVVGGAYVSHETLHAAREAGAAAVVVGGFDDRDLVRLLGRDLGVAITGQEDLGFTLVLTEGFGHVAMAQRTWSLLRRHAGEVASVSGATQIRAGVQRPEILVPLAGGAEVRDRGAETELNPGSLIRVIRAPGFGRIARVVELPPEPRALETEALVRVLVAEFVDGGERVVVPRANVERIED